MSPPCTLSERPLRRTFIRTNAAAGHTGIRPYADGFNVVGCTATRNSFIEGLLPGVDARDNTSTTGTGVPIYWLKGARVANNYADFYDGSWDDEANVKNESGSNGLDTNQSANYPWTGCEDDGTDTEGLGNSDEAVIVGRPDSSDTGHGPISSSEYEDSSEAPPGNYKIEYRRLSDTNWTSSGIVDKSDRAETISSLAANTTYEVRVRMIPPADSTHTYRWGYARVYTTN